MSDPASDPDQPTYPSVPVQTGWITEANEPAASPVAPPLARLSVELRVAGMLTAFWWWGLLHALLWSYGTGPTLSDLREIPWLTLAAPQLVAYGLVMVRLFQVLPPERWPRHHPKQHIRSAWPWLLIGAPALVVAAPLLWQRDRKARQLPRSAARVEFAFHQLLGAPRALALRFAGTGAVAYALDAVILGTHMGWPRPQMVAMALLWIAIHGPLAAIIFRVAHAQLRPEVLGVPPPDRPHKFQRRTGLIPPLILSSTIIGACTIVAPLSAGYLWMARLPMIDAAAHLNLLVIIGTIALAASVVALLLLVADLRRDVIRASNQVVAVVHEQPTDMLDPGSLSTGEIYELVGAVDRLIVRIRQATVAKYVAIERTKEGDRLKSQFLANMSHDLRSPLNSILGFSELLLRGIDGELRDDQRTMVQQINDSGHELLQQIDDILDTAKLEARRLDLHPEPAPPANIISRAIHSARERQRDRVNYDTEIAPGLRPTMTDPYRIVQALTNILLFAGERMSSGTIRIRAREGRSKEGRRIFVQVHTPIKPASTEHLARARRGFYRIPGHRGLGLGLPLAGAILELSGGSLSIEDLGEGMVFTAAIPASQRRASFWRIRSIVPPSS